MLEAEAIWELTCIAGGLFFSFPQKKAVAIGLKLQQPKFYSSIDFALYAITTRRLGSTPVE